MIGAILPAVALTYWKSIWKHLSDEESDNRSTEWIKIFQRNNYRALISLVQSQYLRTHGPTVLAIDSLDDLKNPFDTNFLFKTLIPYLNKRRLVIIGISKLPTENRIDFQSNLESVHIFLLDHPSPNSAKPYPAKKTHAGRIEYQHLKQVLTQISESYPLNSLNEWTLLILLATATHLSRRGFTLKELYLTFQSKVALLNSLLSASADGQETTTSQTQEILRSLILNEPTKQFFLFNTTERKYFYDFSAQMLVLDDSPIQWRLIGRAFWLSCLLDELQQSPSAWACFDASKLAYCLQEELSIHAPLRNQIEPILSTIALISADIVAQTSRTAYADLRESCSLLYFIARSLSSLTQEVTAEDVTCLSALIIYGRIDKEKLAKLCKLLSDLDAPSPLLELAERSICSREELPTPTVANQPEGDFRSLLRWLHENRVRRSLIAPMLLLEEAGTEWEDYEGKLPQVAGGFNLSTMSVLTALTDANCTKRADSFLRLWHQLAQGTLNLSQLNPTEWEQAWIEFMSVLLTSEMVIFLADSSSTTIYDHEGFRHDIGLHPLTDNLLQTFSQISCNISASVPSDSSLVLPITALRSLNDALEDIRVKLLLLSLDNIASILTIQRARLTYKTMNLNEAHRNIRGDLAADLKRVSTLSPPILRSTLRAEALLSMHQINSSVHKSLGADCLTLLLEEFEILGCPDSYASLIHERYIHELRFSHSHKSLQLAASLLTHQLENNSQSDKLRTARLYCKLALDLLKLKDNQGARECWRRAKNSFEEFSLPLQEQSAIDLFRDTELLLFVERVRIFGEEGNEDQRRIEKLLRDNRYYESSSHSFLQLIWLASKELPDERLDMVIDAIERVDLRDWYAGYIWCLILELLHKRLPILRTDDQLTNRAIPLLISKIKNSDKSGINLSTAISTLQTLSRYSPPVGSNSDLSDVLEDLRARNAAVNFDEALTLWMRGGTIGEVAVSYYRLVQPYVEERLPQDVKRWKLEADYNEFRDTGLNLISKYGSNDRDTSWVAIYIAGHLERRGKPLRDQYLEDQLQGVWATLGVSCIESLLKCTITSAALPASLRIILRSQMDDFAKNRLPIIDD